MELLKKKSENSLIALILMLTITPTALLVSFPLANAHDPPWTVPTTAYVTCAPGTVGVGQQTTIICWLDRYSPTTGGTTGQVWNGWQINITKPDGKTEIIGPWAETSAVASDWKVYTPDQVGKYTIVFSWPGGTVTSSIATYSSVDIGDIFLGATSEPTTLIVQEEAIPSWPESPLPTDYWTRPINSQNRGWSTIASNWLKGTWLLPGGFQNEGTAPNSPHVLWAEPILASSPLGGSGYPGGIADAQWPGIQYNINDYQNAWVTPIIMNGVIYYNAPMTQNSVKYGYYAVDLHTGERLWYKNGTDNGLNNPYSIYTPGSNGYSYGQVFEVLTCGQLVHIDTVNGQGAASYLWMQYQTALSGVSFNANTWYMLDPSTGNVILTLKNVPSGTSATDQDGNLLIYSYNRNTGNLLCWNSTHAIYPGSATGSGQQGFWPAVGAVIDAVNDSAWVNASTTWGASFDPTLKEALKTPHSGYSMNVTIPAGLPGSMTILQDERRVPKAIFASSVTGTYPGSIGAGPSGDTISVWFATINEHAVPYSPWPTLPSTVNNNLGFTVSLNYFKNITVPYPGKNYTWSVPVVNYGAKVFFIECQQTRQEWCYDLTTGDPLWGPTIQLPSMGFYTTGGSSGFQGNVYYGIYLGMNAANYYGQIYAYNVTTGALLWIYNATATYGYESYYGNNMPLMLGCVCDGKIFVESSEHSPTNPLWRQSYLRCINITYGTEIWKLQDYQSTLFSQGPAIADGYIVTCSQYDNLIYCIGKGPSGTTVSAPQTEIVPGQKIVISGSVTDQSPGARAYANKFGLTAGVAAVSDATQEAWMEYLYEQQIKPWNATGVPVSIDAIDPNNNYIHIGDVTSDASGTFGYSWITPDVPGQYKIIASFKGSESYGSSSAQTYACVGEAAATASPYPEVYLPPTEIYFAVSTAAIIVTIIVVGAVLALLQRKRP